MRHRVGRVVVEQLKVHVAVVGDDLQDLVGLRHERCRQIAPVGSLLLDVVTLKLGVPEFVLFIATRTGEPMAMFAGGAITVRPLCAATATNTVPVVLLPTYR